MIRLTRNASLWMRPARRCATSGSGSETSVSARRPSAPHRRLQLMAHVGHEVTADLLEAAALRHVFDQRDHAQRRRPSSIWRARTCKRAAAVARRGRACARPIPRARRPPAPRSPAWAARGIAVAAGPSARWRGRCGRSPCRSRRRGRHPGSGLSSERPQADGVRSWTPPRAWAAPPVTCSRPNRLVAIPRSSLRLRVIVAG